MKKRHIQKFVLLSIVLWVCFNIPILLLFNSSDSFLGLPMIHFYVFSVWILSAFISLIIFKKYDE